MVPLLYLPPQKPVSVGGWNIRRLCDSRSVLVTDWTPQPTNRRVQCTVADRALIASESQQNSDLHVGNGWGVECDYLETNLDRRWSSGRQDPNGVPTFCKCRVASLIGMDLAFKATTDNRRAQSAHIAQLKSGKRGMSGLCPRR